MHFTAKAAVAACLLIFGVEASPTRPAQNARNIGRRGAKSTTWKPEAFAAASPNEATPHYFELRKHKTGNWNPRSAAWLLDFLPIGDPSSFMSLEMGKEFATSITIGNQTFDVIVDTGSSDTWVVLKDYECLIVGTETQVAESKCAFGPPYAIDSTFEEIPGEFFNITYGDGESIAGYFGTEEVTLAGLTVRQQIAVANFTAWNGDGTTSGLTGFAYPSITSAYSENSTQFHQVVYNPLFTTMYKDGLIPPMFSLAILRDVSGPAGFLALGGLPPVPFLPFFTSTPILITNLSYPGFTPEYQFYTINIDGVTVNDQTLAKGAGGPGIQYIVDSGTTLNYYPTDIANAVNAAFDPPGVYDAQTGSYVVECNAQPPKHGITISGHTFYINPLDMILYTGKYPNGTDRCISGVLSGGSNVTTNLFVLGDPFQKNVITVFDVGAVEMRFAPNEYYPSNDQY